MLPQAETDAQVGLITKLGAGDLEKELGLSRFTRYLAFYQSLWFVRLVSLHKLRQA